MFRIVLNALWSKDFQVLLTRTISHYLRMSYAEAEDLVRKIEAGEHPVVYMDELRHATEFMQQALQFGVYAGIEQIKGMTETHIASEFKALLNEDTGDWVVLLDDSEQHVQRIIDGQLLASLRFETQQIMDLVGEEILQRGATPIDQAGYETIKERVAQWKISLQEYIRVSSQSIRRRKA